MITAQWLQHRIYQKIMVRRKFNEINKKKKKQNSIIKISVIAEYLHLTTTTNGNILTLDRKNGKFLWKNDLTSPVVAAFLLGPEGLLSVPFTTVSEEAFQAILEESKDGNVNTVKLL